MKITILYGPDVTFDSSQQILWEQVECLGDDADGWI